MEKSNSKKQNNKTVSKKKNTNCNCKKYEQEIISLKQKITDNENFFLSKLNEKAEQANKIIKAKIEEVKIQSQREINEIKKYAIEPYACELIDIINQFEKALSYESKDEKIRNYQSGFKMFVNMFKSALSNMNIKEINVKVGDEFDGKTMECLELVESNNLKNSVVEIINNGYLLHDRVIKPTLVKVSK